MPATRGSALSRSISASQALGRRRSARTGRRRRCVPRAPGSRRRARPPRCSPVRQDREARRGHLRLVVRRSAARRGDAARAAGVSPAPARRAGAPSPEPCRRPRPGSPARARRGLPSSLSISPAASSRSGSSAASRYGRLMRTLSAAPRMAAAASSAATPTSLTALRLPIGASRSASVEHVAAAMRAVCSGARVASRVAAATWTSRACRSRSVSLRQPARADDGGVGESRRARPG